MYIKNLPIAKYIVTKHYTKFLGKKLIKLGVPVLYIDIDNKYYFADSFELRSTLSRLPLYMKLIDKIGVWLKK